MQGEWDITMADDDEDEEDQPMLSDDQASTDPGAQASIQDILSSESGVIDFIHPNSFPCSAICYAVWRWTTT